MNDDFLKDKLTEQKKTRNNLRIRFRDLRIANPKKRARVLREVERVLEFGPIMMGPKVAAFEQTFGQYANRRYCVGVSSGTDALYLSLRACSIGRGDEVITTAMSWVATANAIAMTGATPIFIDVREDQNIEPKKIENSISCRTKAIVPVHFTGRLCDMAAISDIAQKNGLLVIEDSAQSMGAKGVASEFSADSVGDVAAFSLNPMKVFPGYGEAGAVVTDDPVIDRRLRTLRYLGTERKNLCVEVSLNSKMDEIQAAMLLTGFDGFDDTVRTRIEMAKRYSEQLSGTIRCPRIPQPGDWSSNFYDYVVFSDYRDKLRHFLYSKGIETKVNHPVLLPDHPAHKKLPRPSIPVADRLVRTMVSLPLHDKMTAGDVNFICENISEFCASPDNSPILQA